MTAPEPVAGKHAAGVDSEFFRSLSHPLRWRLLTVLDEREASPKELAEFLDEDFERVAYHVRELRKAGFIELVDTDNKRGGTQHIYKAIIRPVVGVPEAALMPRQVREAISASILPLIYEDLERATGAGTIDSHPQRSLLRMGLVMDEEGMKETGEAAMAYLDALKEVQARSAERLAREKAEGFNVATATLVFPLPPPE
jgi:DNA-binding transcriptional ArsR family regulator